MFFSWEITELEGSGVVYFENYEKRGGGGGGAFIRGGQLKEGGRLIEVIW